LGVCCLEEGGVIGNLTQDRGIPMTDEAMSPLRRRMIEDMLYTRSGPTAVGNHPASKSKLRAVLNSR